MWSKYKYNEFHSNNKERLCLCVYPSLLTLTIPELVGLFLWNCVCVIYTHKGWRQRYKKGTNSEFKSPIYITNEICLSVRMSARLQPKRFDLRSWNFMCVIYTWYEGFLSKKISEKSKKKNSKIFPKFFFIAEGRAWRRPKGAKRRVFFENIF